MPEKIFYDTQGKEELFSYFEQGKAVVSIIGAGGKSTIMEQFANYLTEKGKRVLVSTTTHIWKPGSAFYGENEDQVEEIWKSGRYAVIGSPTRDGKLSAPTQEWLNQMGYKADVVLLEADGAKGRPCKIANQNEPVLITNTTAVIVVVGIDAIGQSLKEGCFRHQLAMEYLEKKENQIIDITDVVKLVKRSVEEVKQKRIDVPCFVVIHKCDTEELKKQGRALSNLLKLEEGK